MLPKCIARALRRVAPLVIVLGVLTGVLRGGTRYFYCPAMEAVMGAACCGGSHASAHREQPNVQSPDCCEERVHGRLPLAATTHVGTMVFDAPLLAILPVVTALPRPFVDPRVRVTHHERAGPRSAAQRRAELMVFLN